MKVIFLSKTFLFVFFAMSLHAQPGRISPNAKKIDCDDMRPFQEGYAVVRKGSAYGVIDAKGAFLAPHGKYIEAEGFVNGLCRVGIRRQDKNGGWVTLYGFIDSSGNEVIPCVYTAATSFSKFGFAYASKVHRQSLLLDKKGKETIMTQDALRGGMLFNPPIPGQEIMTPKGVCDRLGNLKAPGEFELYHQFSEGLAAVGKRDQFGKLNWGFIDTAGRTVISFQFSKEPGDFSQGLAVVFPADNREFAYGYIDKAGALKIKITEQPGVRALKLANAPGTPELAFAPSGVAMTAMVKPDGTPFLMDREGTFFTVADLIKRNGTTTIPSASFKSFRGDEIIFSAPVGKTGSLSGIIKTSGAIAIPPAFFELTPSDPVSGLSYATVIVDINRMIFTKGYVDKDGVFVIVMTEASKW